MVTALPPILIVEDNPISQKIIILQLEQMGYKVHLATNGVEAIVALAQRSYHLVLMDYQMPYLDGIEATRYIRANEQKTNRHTPIIAITGNNLESLHKACLDAGMDDFLPKPIHFKQLIIYVERWVTDDSTESHNTANKKLRITELEPLIYESFGKLAEVHNTDASLLLTLIDIYMLESPTLLEHLRLSLFNRNWMNLHLTAQRLKSIISYLGAENFGSYYSELEDLSQRATLEEVNKKLFELEEIHNVLLRVLQNVRKTYLLPSIQL